MGNANLTGPAPLSHANQPARGIGVGHGIKISGAASLRRRLHAWAGTRRALHWGAKAEPTRYPAGRESGLQNRAAALRAGRRTRCGRRPRPAGIDGAMAADRRM